MVDDVVVHSRAQIFPIPEVPRASNHLCRITVLSHPRARHPIFSRVRPRRCFSSATNLDIAGNERLDVLNCGSDGLLCLLALCQWMGLLEGSERNACINRLCRRKLCLHEFHIKATYNVSSDASFCVRSVETVLRSTWITATEATRRDVQHCMILKLYTGTRLRQVTNHRP